MMITVAIYDFGYFGMDLGYVCDALPKPEILSAFNKLPMTANWNSWEPWSFMHISNIRDLL